VQVQRQVLVQNYTRTTARNGREVVKRREKTDEGGDGLPPASIRLTSPYDTDARWAAKRDTFWNGYKIHISETCAPQADDAIRQALAVTDLRQARYRDLAKTHLEHVYSAVALNLIRLDARWNGHPLDRTRTTHLTRLEPRLAA
jgi:hypothetical protein